MADQLNLTQLLTCNVCGDILSEPITLSCGNTICSHCFPVNSPSNKKSVFVCPISQCTSASHLFGPELLVDASISEIANILREYLASCPCPLSPVEEYENGYLDALSRAVVPYLRCSGCHLTTVDPITSHCGHTFCRLCILQTKVDSDNCNVCYRPLPKYSHLSAQSSNKLIAQMIKSLQFAGALPFTTTETALLDANNNEQRNVPLFVSNNVILPGQKFKLPVFNAAHLNMFRSSLIPSSRYSGLCLASVHRNKPQVAQFGTILKIVGVEHRPDAIMIDVVGTDRFKLDSHREENESTLFADFELLPEASITQFGIEFPCSSAGDVAMIQEHAYGYSVELADTILHFIHHLGQAPNMPNGTLHAQTQGILGPLWFENMKTIHGAIPSKSDPAAVCWWAAVVLPTAPNDLYGLLRTVPLVDRLELVITWMQAMQNQWERCRSTAINAINRVANQYQ